MPALLATPENTLAPPAAESQPTTQEQLSPKTGLHKPSTEGTGS